MYPTTFCQPHLVPAATHTDLPVGVPPVEVPQKSRKRKGRPEAGYDENTRPKKVRQRGAAIPQEQSLDYYFKLCLSLMGEIFSLQRQSAPRSLRDEANDRERQRTRSMNDGFARLRKAVPSQPYDKTSKIRTLQLAAQYIEFLEGLVNGEKHAGSVTTPPVHQECELGSAFSLWRLSGGHADEQSQWKERNRMDNTILDDSW